MGKAPILCGVINSLSQAKCSKLHPWLIASNIQTSCCIHTWACGNQKLAKCGKTKPTSFMKCDCVCTAVATFNLSRDPCRQAGELKPSSLMTTIMCLGLRRELGFQLLPTSPDQLNIQRQEPAGTLTSPDEQVSQSHTALLSAQPMHRLSDGIHKPRLSSRGFDGAFLYVRMYCPQSE